MEATDPVHLLLLFTVLILLFFLSMFFSSAETAFLSLNKLHLRFLCEQKNRAAQQAEKILQNKQKFLSTILIGNSIVNIAISVVLTAVGLQLFGAAGLSIAVFVGTILVLIFGEIVPKSLALAYHNAIAFGFARIILFFMSIFSPIVWIFSTITYWLLRLCGIEGKKNSAALTDSDLRDFFETSEEKGLIENEECVVFKRILQYGDFSARTIMTPRPRIVAIQMGARMEDIVQLAKTSNFSCFPVYDTDIDSIKGFFYIKDFLFSPEFVEGKEDVRIEKYLRKPIFVFETIKLAELEKYFSLQKQNMAIVIDEYGGTAGLVTMSDLYAEIFGSLVDEHTVQKNPPQYPHTSSVDADNTQHIHIISAAMRLRDINEQFNTAIVSDYHDTIGGYIMETAGEIPPCGFSVVIEPYRFTVYKTAEHKIEQVAVQFEDVNT